MQSVEEIINWLFGGQVDVTKIVTLLVSAWAIVQSIVAWRSKLAAIRSDKSVKTQNKLIDEMAEDNKKLKETNAALADIMVTAYLSNPNIDPETKKEIASKAKKLEEVASIDFSAATVEIVDQIDKYIPGTSLAERKEELEAAAEAAESVIDGVNEGTQSAIDKIHLG